MLSWRVEACGVCVYVGRQLGVGLQSAPDLRLEAAVGEDLSNQTQFTGLNRRQLLVEQQHLTGLQTQKQVHSWTLGGSDRHTGLSYLGGAH